MQRIEPDGIRRGVSDPEHRPSTSREHILPRDQRSGFRLGHETAGDETQQEPPPDSPRHGYEPATSLTPDCSSALREVSRRAARSRLILVYTTTTTTRYRITESGRDFTI